MGDNVLAAGRVLELLMSVALRLREPVGDKGEEIEGASAGCVCRVETGDGTVPVRLEGAPGCAI